MFGKQFSLHRRGKIWYCEFKTASGKFDCVKSTRCTRKADAEKFAIENLSLYSTVKNPTSTFKEFTEDFFSQSGTWYINRCADRHSTPIKILTVYTNVLKKHLIPHFGNMKLSAISKSIIREYRTRLIKEEYSGATISLILGTLRHIMKEAADTELITICPEISSVKNTPKKKGILTKDEIIRLFNSDWEDLRCYTAVLIAASTGARLAEILALSPSEIDVERKIIHIRRSFNSAFKTLNLRPKSGKNRVCPISDFVLEKIQELIAANPYPTPNYIFYSSEYDFPINREFIISALRKQLTAIGVDWEKRLISFHSFRSYFNSLLINANIPLPMVQAMIGHSSDELTNLYYRPDENYDAIRTLQNQQIILH